MLYAGEEIARIKLVASEDVSRNVLLFIGATIKKVASSTIFKIIASIVAILVVGYIALFVYETTSAARDASSSSSIPESRVMNILRKGQKEEIIPGLQSYKEGGHERTDQEQAEYGGDSCQHNMRAYLIVTLGFSRET